MASEKRWRRLIFSWTAAKSIIAVLLYLVIMLLLEYLVINAFLSYGLKDDAPLTGSFQVPGSETIFTVSISPVFHLIPLGVIVTLISSWMYLTRRMAVVPFQVSPKRRKETKRKPALERKPRFAKLRWFTNPVRRFFRRVRWRLKGIGSAVKSSFHKFGTLLKIDRLSSLYNQSHFFRAALRGATVVISSFLLLTLGLYLFENPTFLYKVVSSLYQNNPSLLRFAFEAHKFAEMILQPLNPGGWLSGLALGFRGVMSSFVPLTAAIAELDVLWKYLICQYLTASASTIVTLLYGRYGLR